MWTSNARQLRLSAPLLVTVRRAWSYALSWEPSPRRELTSASVFGHVGRRMDGYREPSSHDSLGG